MTVGVGTDLSWAKENLWGNGSFKTIGIMLDVS